MVVRDMKIIIKSKLMHYFKVTHIPDLIHICINDNFLLYILRFNFPLLVGRLYIVGLYLFYMSWSASDDCQILMERYNKHDGRLNNFPSEVTWAQEF